MGLGDGATTSAVLVLAGPGNPTVVGHVVGHVAAGGRIVVPVADPATIVPVADPGGTAGNCPASPPALSSPDGNSPHPPAASRPIATAIISGLVNGLIRDLGSVVDNSLDRGRQVSFDNGVIRGLTSGLVRGLSSNLISGLIMSPLHVSYLYMSLASRPIRQRCEGSSWSGIPSLLVGYLPPSLSENPSLATLLRVFYHWFLLLSLMR